MRSRLQIGSLMFAIEPNGGEQPIITRDGTVVDVVMDDQHPLDVAQALSSNANTVTVSGKITLMAVACALVASGIPLKPTIGRSLRQSAEIGRLCDMLETACVRGADSLRMLMQRLTDEPVAFLNQEQAKFGGAQELDGEPAFVGKEQEEWARRCGDSSFPRRVLPAILLVWVKIT